MIKKIYFLYALITLLVATPVVAQNENYNVTDVEENCAEDSSMNDSLSKDTVALPWPQSVQSHISKLLQRDMFHTSQVALMVFDLTADSVIYKFNEGQLMRPASTMKLVTAIAAIDRLGGSFQFKTQLKYTGKIENNTLIGDVYCIGGFDPRFNADDMNAFVESLKKMGVDTIRGNLYADKSMKNSDLMGNGWCWDDDNPVLSPLVFARKDRFMDRFEQELHDAGIVFSSFSTTKTCPADAYEVCTRFHTIDQILMRMMKESDNLYAEAMFYQLAASQGDRPASAKDARNVINKLITKIGLKPSGYRIADGCGLSLYNYISAELEVKLLRYAFENGNIYLHLLPSLPVAGMDGTLKSRMRTSFTSGNVKAKTGTVAGISSLAGYCTASNGHKLCFCIINQGLLHGRNGRTFQDRVCNALCSPQ